MMNNIHMQVIPYFEYDFRILSYDVRDDLNNNINQRKMKKRK